MELFEQKIDNEGVYYLWNGKRVDSIQRAMWPWYEHVSVLGELHVKRDSLADIRFTAAKKYFSSKDSTHANIFRHFQEVMDWKEK